MKKYLLMLAFLIFMDSYIPGIPMKNNPQEYPYITATYYEIMYNGQWVKIYTKDKVVKVPSHRIIAIYEEEKK